MDKLGTTRKVIWLVIIFPIGTAILGYYGQILLLNIPGRDGNEMQCMKSRWQIGFLSERYLENRISLGNVFHSPQKPAIRPVAQSSSILTSHFNLDLDM